MTTATLNETDACPTCGRSSDNGPCLCPEEASSPTAADWDAAAEYFASLADELPPQEDFPDVTPERVRQIVELCGGVAPF